ncbi:polysaccharide deacetylase family protein [Aneurinibacillus sp. REN35]|uniref:polysaccharide deacetylase family protein n=2 Tax=Paenibacillaceae TaxID=186822 RepID=UPI003528C326
MLQQRKKELQKKRHQQTKLLVIFCLSFLCIITIIVNYLVTSASDGSLAYARGSHPASTASVNAAEAAEKKQPQETDVPATKEEPTNKEKNDAGTVDQPAAKPADEKTPSEKTGTKPPVSQPAAALPFGKLISNIPVNNSKTVYLTFDDGPGPYTKEIASILEKNNVRGSFFWVGKNMTDESGGWGRQLVENGHIIGSHTMYHERLGNKNKEAQKQEMSGSTDFIAKKIGHPITYFRPPYGSVNAATKEASQETKKYIMYWQVDSLDWKLAKHPEQILTNIKTNVKPGAIILMHERAQSAKVLPEVIQWLKTNGYTIAPLPATTP